MCGCVLEQTELKKAKDSEEKCICACCLNKSHELMSNYITTCIVFSVFLNNWFNLSMESVQMDIKAVVGKHVVLPINSFYYGKLVQSNRASVHTLLCKTRLCSMFVYNICPSMCPGSAGFCKYL